MNRTRTLTLTALLAPALAAALAPADKVAFHPEAGSKLTRTYALKNNFSLDDFSMSMDGKPLPMDLEMEMDMSVGLDITVSDQFVALGAGRPKELVRNYDKLATAGSFSIKMPMMPDGGMDKSITGSSELEGKAVKFTWNEEGKKFDVAYKEGEGDAKLLEHLEEDMDLRGLLPEKEVSSGDTWDIPVKSFRAILAPGGNLGIKPKAEKEEEGMGMMPGMDNFGDMASMLGDTFEGEGKGEYKGTREVDGVTVGVIHLTLKMKSSNDMSEIVKKAVPELPEGVGKLDIDHVDVDADIEGEGTLLWNIAGGHVQSLEMSGKMKMAMETGLAISAQGRDMNMEQSMSMSGTISNTLAVSKN
jgi:hypothetical protein